MCDLANNTDLTPKMRAGIEYICEHLTASWTEVAEASGVTLAAVCKWRKNPKWQDALEHELHRIFKEAQKVALSRMLDIATNGEDKYAVQAAKFLMENGGFKASEKVELNTNDITIKINND